MIKIAGTGSAESFEATFTYTEPSGPGSSAGTFLINHNKGKNPHQVRLLVRQSSDPENTWINRPDWYLYLGTAMGTSITNVDLNQVRLDVYGFTLNSVVRTLKATLYFS